MTQRAALFAAMSSFVLVAGCAGAPKPSYLHVPQSARGHIASTDVVLPIKQNEIYIFVPSTAGAASAAGASFGLLGALVAATVSSGIDAANAHAAETAIKPVRDSIVDYNFDSVLQEDLKTALSREAWLNAGEASVVKEVTNDKLESILTGSKSSAVLLVTADYQLSKDADLVTVSVTPCLFPISPELKSLLPADAPKGGLATRPEKSLYCNTLAYRDAIAGAGTDLDANLALWAANNGGAMRAALKNSSTRLSQMLVTELEAAPGPDVDLAKSGMEKVTVDFGPGYVTGSDEQGSFLRFATGREMYVTKVALAKAVAPAPHKQSAVERA
ncbi:MAG: hypothetical protein ABI740_08280 [Alphaproteobacteria bacterium]